MFFQQFFFFPSTISRLELFIASLAWGYKVSNTIEPAKTDDCHSGRAFRPHEPIGCAKKHKQKEHRDKNKTNSAGLLFFWKSQRKYYVASKLIGTELNTIKRLILTGIVYCSVITLYVASCILHATTQATSETYNIDFRQHMSECVSYYDHSACASLLPTTKRSKMETVESLKLLILSFPS